jgi:hypothetical protein
VRAHQNRTKERWRNRRVGGAKAGSSMAKGYSS